MGVRNVRSIWEVVDAATKPLQKIAKSAYGTAKAIGDGFKPGIYAVSTMANGAWQAASAVSSLMNPVTALVGSIASLGTAKGLIEMNSQLEGTQLSITGALRAFDAVGESAASISKKFKAGTDEWAAAQHKAFVDAGNTTKAVLASIEKDAAALPGSAEDYVQVFKTALPAALSAGMTDIQKIAKFTNDFAATAVANQVDSQQAADDMARMLRGQAGAQVKTWQVLMPLIGKSAEQFNKMTAPKRAAAMQTALLKYKPLLNEFGNTWDAIYGTTEATVKSMLRGASTPLFNAAKDAFASINGWLDKNSKLISGPLTTGFEKLVSYAEKLGAVLAKVNFTKIGRTLTGDGHLGKALGIMSAVRMGAAFGPMGMVAGLGAAAVAKNSGGMESIGPVLEKVSSVFGQVVDAVWPLVESIGTAAGSILTSLMPAVSAVASIFGDMMKQIAPMIPELGTGLAQTVKNLTPLFIGLVNATIQLTPLIVGLAQGIVSLTQTLSSWINSLMDWIPDKFLPQEMLAAKARMTADSMEEATNHFTSTWMHSSDTVTAQNEAWARGVMANVDIGHVMNEGFSAVADTYNNGAAKIQATTEAVHIALAQHGEAASEFGSATRQAETIMTMSVMGMAGPMGALAENFINLNDKALTLGTGLESAQVAALAMAAGGFGGFGAGVYAKADKFLAATAPGAAPDIGKHGVTPVARGGSKVHNDFRYSRFDIKQMFAEGFDPDRIGVAFVNELTAAADQKLSSGLAPVFGTR